MDRTRPEFIRTTAPTPGGHALTVLVHMAQGVLVSRDAGAGAKKVAELLQGADFLFTVRRGYRVCLQVRRAIRRRRRCIRGRGNHS